MAKLSKSMSVMNFQISGRFGLQSLSSHSRNRIFYHLTKAKKEVLVLGSVGKQICRWKAGEELYIKHLLERHPDLKIFALL